MIRHPARVLWIGAILIILTSLASSAAIEVLDAFYRPDQMLPEWNCFYSSSYRPGDTIPARIQGGLICVYVYNNGGGAATLSDFTINGMGLVAGLRCKTDKTYKQECQLYACSVYYPYPKAVLVDAGEPVWWRIEPESIPAGGTGEVVVRMRRTVPGTLACTVVPGSGSAIPVTIPVSGADCPRIVDYYYASDTNKLFLYVRHPQKGKIPTSVYVDQTNVTSSCAFAADPNVDVVSIRATVSSLARGSHHVFRAIYDDGTKATFGLRVYSDGFKYGTWNCPDLDNETEQRNHLLDLVRHSVNLFTMGTGALGDYLKSSEGHQIMDQNGIKKSHSEKTSDRLYSIFTCDEPDTAEGNIPDSVAPVGSKTGALAQHMIYQIRDGYRGSYAIYPTIVNIDGGEPPYVWYNWGHVADMFCHDGYFMVRLRDSYTKYPWRIPFFSKCTWRYASARTAKVACEPRREHIIMDCNRMQDQEAGWVYRWPTPTESRIMAYYAVAAGAKELGYWWLAQLTNTGSGANGLTDQPGSIAIWREMGLVGAEMGTVGNLIVNSSPAEFAVTAPGRLWVRTLVNGLETIMLVCVNDDYTVDQAGSVLRPIPDAQVSLDLPSWLGSPTDVFEVDYKGVRDVSKTIAGGKVTMDLGRVDATRMLLITKDSTLKSTLQALYANTYGPRVAELIPLP